ncbi:MAG: hypothetical protein JRH20_30055 [Deltaproteobacteria bacterium]|nr:hypothetical protein [Deltaproteobacteria bacterium]
MLAELAEVVYRSPAVFCAMTVFALTTVMALAFAWRRRRRLKHHVARSAPKPSCGWLPEVSLLVALVFVVGTLGWEIYQAHGIIIGELDAGKLGRWLAGSSRQLTNVLLLLLFLGCVLPLSAMGLVALWHGRQGRSPWKAALGVAACSVLLLGPLLVMAWHTVERFRWTTCCYCSLSWFERVLSRIAEIGRAVRWLELGFWLSFLVLLVITLFFLRRIRRKGSLGFDARPYGAVASAFFFAAALLLLAIAPYRAENLEPLVLPDALTGRVPRSILAPSPRGLRLEPVGLGPVFVVDETPGKPSDIENNLWQSSLAQGIPVFVSDARLPTARAREFLLALHAGGVRNVQLAFCRDETLRRPVRGTYSRRRCSALRIELVLSAASSVPMMLPDGRWGECARALARLAMEAPQQKLRLVIDGTALKALRLWEGTIGPCSAVDLEPFLQDGVDVR